MAVDITEGEVSAIRLLRTIDAHAPAEVKNRFQSLVDNGDWPAFLQAAEPLLKKFSLPSFTASDVGFVAPLTEPQRDVVLFYAAIKAPTAAEFKARIDGLLGWGAWESVAKIVSANDKIPFRFDAADIRRVFDPAGSLPEMSDGQAQAKTFLKTIAANPDLIKTNQLVSKYLAWGGFESVAAMVTAQPNTPFKFGGDDVRAVADPSRTIQPRSAAQITLLSQMDTLEQVSKTDEKVSKFYSDIQDRIHHGCWKSIADIFNGLDKFPLKPISEDLLRSTLDPTGQYGSDDVCAALAPPEPPAWTKPIVWTVGAGLAAYGWTVGAANEVADWTTGAAGDVKDWTMGAADSVADWTSGAYGDAADWTTGAMDSASDWTVGAANDVADWASGAADSAAKAAAAAAQAAQDAANSVARAAEDAANAAAEAAKKTANAVVDWGRGAADTISGWFS